MPLLLTDLRSQHLHVDPLNNQPHLRRRCIPKALLVLLGEGSPQILEGRLTLGRLKSDEQSLLCLGIPELQANPLLPRHLGTTASLL